MKKANPTSPDNQTDLEKFWVLLRNNGYEDPEFAEVMVAAEDLISAYDMASLEKAAKAYPKTLFCWDAHSLKESIDGLKKRLARSADSDNRGFLCLVLDRADNTVTEVEIVARSLRVAYTDAIQSRKENIGQRNRAGDCGFSVAMAFDIADLEALLLRLDPTTKLAQ